MNPSTALTKPAPFTVSLTGVSAEDKAAVTSIFEDLQAAGERIKRAGTRWCRLDESVRQRVLESVPGHWHEFLSRLQRVGEGTLHPQLYAVGGRAAATLGRLPIEAQEVYLRDRIPVAILKDGKPDQIRMDVMQMSDAIRRQVFQATPTGYTVRTIAQQRAWIRQQTEAVAARKAKNAASMARITRVGRWVAERGMIFVTPEKAKSGLTRQDVDQIVKDLDTIA